MMGRAIHFFFNLLSFQLGEHLINHKQTLVPQTSNDKDEFFVLLKQNFDSLDSTVEV